MKPIDVAFCGGDRGGDNEEGGVIPLEVIAFSDVQQDGKRMEEIKYTAMSRESRLCQPSSSRVFLEKECELG